MRGILDGQVSVITGAGRGIGQAISYALAEQGSDCVLVSRTASQLDATAQGVRERGQRALVVQTDVTQPEDVNRLADKTTEQFGEIDLLVNNAGSSSARSGGAVGPLWQINGDAWWHDVTVNLRGTFLPTSAFLPAMIDRDRGRIVNIASFSASRASEYHTAYASSKAAVVRLTDSLAVELKSTKVKVFAVSPGAVRTEMTTTMYGSEPAKRWLPELRKHVEASYIDASIPAALVVELASGRADSLSGRFIRVDHDLDDLIERADEIQANDVFQIRFVS